MRTNLLCLAAAMTLFASGTLAQETVSFHPGDERVAISLGDKPFATYVWQDPDVLRPYFAHVRTPAGRQVTRNYPPVEGRDATDHARFHPGIWLAFGDLSGHDFWRNKAKVEHVEFTQKPTAADGIGRFAARNRYVSDGKTICDETCRVEIRPSAPGTLLVWDSVFSGPEDFYFGDQEEMGLGIRVATPITVKAGGQIVNSDAAVNEKQVWGKQADWCDYAGTVDGKPLGIMIMPDPANFRRSWFHARDYGVLVANPFGEKAFTKSAASKVVVRKGESLRLRFGLLIHDGPIDRQAAYKAWLALPR